MNLYDYEEGCLRDGVNNTVPWPLSPPDELIFSDPSLFLNDENNSCNGSHQFMGEPPREHSVLNALNVYVTPVIVIVGITGNLLNFLVFATTHLKRQSSSVYLAFLSVADIGFLIALLIIWFQYFNVPVFHMNVICQIVVYVTYIGKFLSVWLVASFTVERYVIVCHPFKRSKLCTPRRAKMVVIGLSISGLLLYSFAPWTSGTMQLPGGSFCMPLPKYYHLLTICEFVDVLITLIIPFMAIAVLNVRIVIKIHQFRKQMKHVDMKHSLSNTAATTILPTERARPSLLRTSFSTEGTLQFTFRSRYASATRDEIENTAQTKVMRLRKGSQYRTAKMLLVVSSVFLILNLPSHVMRLHAFIRRTVLMNPLMNSSDDLRWSELFLIPYHLNFAINFFLYSACGRPFRRGLKCIYHRFTYRIHKCYSVAKRTKGWDLPRAEHEAALPIHEHALSPEQKE